MTEERLRTWLDLHPAISVDLRLLIIAMLDRFNRIALEQKDRGGELITAEMFQVLLQGKEQTWLEREWPIWRIIRGGIKSPRDLRNALVKSGNHITDSAANFKESRGQHK